MADYQDGETRSINGVTYTRQGGQWSTGGAPSGPVYGAPKPADKPNLPTGYRMRADGQAERIPGIADPIDKPNLPSGWRMGANGVAERIPGLPPGNEVGGKELPLGAISGIQENMKAYKQVQAALEALDKRPESIGPGTGMLGDTFTQFNDPEGTSTRGLIANIGAVKIHDLSGAAVSASEAPRFTPFVPTPQDRPDVAKQKLQSFRDNLKSQIDENLGFYNDPANGYKAFHSPMADQFLKGAVGSPSPAGPGDIGFNTPEAGPKAPVDPNGQGDIGFNQVNQPNGPEGGSAYQEALSSAIKSGQVKDAGGIQAFSHQYNQQNGTNFQIDTSNPQNVEALKGLAQGRFSGVVPPQWGVDINDARPKDETAGNRADLLVRKAADGATLGLATKGQALYDTVASGGTYDYNLARQDAINNVDYNRHPVASTLSTLAGGALLPTGAMAAGNAARESALAGGALATDAAAAGRSALAMRATGEAAGYGAVAGGVNTQGGFGDKAVGAVTGAVVGGVSALGLTKGFGALAARSENALGKPIPELVDSVTGELNAPMDAMSPAQRYATMQNQGIKTITPGMVGGRSARVLEQGLNNLPGSAGVMEDVNAAASKEMRGAMTGVANKFGSSKTLNEGGGELQKGANNWIGRFEKVSGRAYEAIPVSDAAPADLSATRATLKDLTSAFSSNPDLAATLQSPKLVRYKDALEKGGLSWKDTKAFRSTVGYEIGEQRFSDSPTKDQMRSLYAALSEDMKATASSQPGGLRAFERANNLYKAGQDRIDNALVSILGNDSKASPEKAAAAVQAMTKGGKASGDLSKLAQIKASTVKTGAWDEVASTLIRLGGQPANSEGRAFSPQTFVNWYSDMAEPARKLLFKPELRDTLDSFVATNQQLGRSKGLINSSNTTPTMIGSSVVGASGILAVTNPLLLAVPIAGGAANFGMAKTWTNPSFVRWATGYARAAASGNAGAASSRVSRLANIASTNPEIHDAVMGLQQRLMAAMNDNVASAGQLAASPDQRPRQQQ